MHGRTSPEQLLLKLRATFRSVGDGEVLGRSFGFGTNHNRHNQCNQKTVIRRFLAKKVKSFLEDLLAQVLDHLEWPTMSEKNVNRFHGDQGDLAMKEASQNTTMVAGSP